MFDIAFMIDFNVTQTKWIQVLLANDKVDLLKFVS